MSPELLAPRSPPRTKEILCPSHVLDSVSSQSARQRSDEVPALLGGQRSSARLTFALRGGRRAKRGGYPQATLAGRPLERVVRRQRPSERVDRSHSGFTPTSRTTFRHISISFSIVARNCSGPLPAGDMPSV